MMRCPNGKIDAQFYPIDQQEEIDRRSLTGGA